MLGRPYLEKTDAEIQAADFIKNNISGTVFTDQHFANILIMKDFYSVQGISDSDSKTRIIYYQENKSNIISALKSLNVDYIAITKRMRETYLLNLNLPQSPITNNNFYESNFKKIYDNGDVKLYLIENEAKNSSIS